MSSLFDQIKLLHDQELYQNLATLASLVLAISDHSPDCLTPATKYQVLVYYGDALYHSSNYRKAEVIYKKALQLRKSLAKAKGKSQTTFLPESSSETDVKYKIHQCYVQMKQNQQAIEVLESISAKQRTPRVNMALAKLYHESGLERSAVTCYKDVLKECPLAIEAALGLLALGQRGAEVASLMVNGTGGANMDWLSSWIKAHAHLHAKELPQSIATFKQLEAKNVLRDSVDILVSLGEAYYYNGDYTNASAVLERVHSMDPLMIKGMDIYASLLARKKKIKELESLSSHLISTNDAAPEPWIAMAYFCFATRKLTRAVYFAQKACMINHRHVEALLLKGYVLFELKKVQDAITHFSEAYKIATYRYEAHKGLVDCYLDLHRTREAIAIANNACKQLGQTPRALTLYASVLVKDPLSVEKAKTLLEKALKQDPTYLHAVYQLAEIYEQERLYDKGIELLKKQVEIQNTCRLHEMLGDFLARNNEHDKALHHFNIARHLDPSNARAAEGTQRVEQHPDSLENPYDIEEEELGDTDNEGELEESETEAVWSEAEYS